MKIPAVMITTILLEQSGQPPALPRYRVRAGFRRSSTEVTTLSPRLFGTEVRYAVQVKLVDEEILPDVGYCL